MAHFPSFLRVKNSCHQDKAAGILQSCCRGACRTCFMLMCLSHSNSAWIEFLRTARGRWPVFVVGERTRESATDATDAKLGARRVDKFIDRRKSSEKNNMALQTERASCSFNPRSCSDRDVVRRFTSLQTNDNSSCG